MNATFAPNAETAYDWRRDQWTESLKFSVSQLVMIGEQSVRFQLGAHPHIEKPDGGPDWGVRLGLTFRSPR